MNELYKIIIDYAKEYPILIPFVLFVFWYLKNENFRKIINKSTKKILRLSFGNQILAHDLFFQKNLFLAQVKRVKFNSQHKTDIFRALLEIKVKSVNDVTYSELRQKYKLLKKSHPAEVAAELLSVLDKIQEKIETDLLASLKSKYGDYTGKKVFDYVYLKIVKPQDELILESIEKRINRMQFSTSKNFDDILRSFLSKLQDATDDAIVDCEADFKDANGQIDELIQGK